ncbi:MAG: transcriptional regulator [Alsobacter sp.]|jgi:predicted transcriptional regulator
MTDRTIHIHVESPEAMWARSLSAAKRLDAGEIDFAGEHLSFANMATYLAAITPKRLELVARLKQVGPCSIRALSKEITRDYKSVHQDLSKLIEIGLVERREDGLVEAPYDTIVSTIKLAAA